MPQEGATAMSYDPLRSASFDFGEHHSREHINFYPPDFEIGFKYFKDFHTCIFCGTQEHESKLIRNEESYWIHQECDDYWKELDKLTLNKTS